MLARQLISPVRFTQSMEMVVRRAEAPEVGFEVGPGNVLTGLDEEDRPGSSRGVDRGWRVLQSGARTQIVEPRSAK